MPTETSVAQQEPASPWLTVRQAAAIPPCSEKTIYEEIRRGKLRAARIGNGRGMLRIHRDWITDYLVAASEPREVGRG